VIDVVNPVERRKATNRFAIYQIDLAGFQRPLGDERHVNVAVPRIEATIRQTPDQINANQPPLELVVP
jgi:hypothetical protein